MTTQLQLRRGTTVQNDAFTGAQGEVTYDTDLHQLRVHDGILNEQTGIMEGTQGGFVIDNNTTVVHKTNNLSETINGTKTFTNGIYSTSGGTNLVLRRGSSTYSETQTQLTDGTRTGGFRNINDNGNTTTMYVADGTTIKGSISVIYDGSTTYTAAPTPAASSSKSETKIATTGWVNDYTKSTMVVHREGAETIDGIKTFSQGIVGTVNRSLWADLAEQYLSDEKYPIGTLIKFGGEKDITIADNNCNGVISEKPGLLLDYGLEDSLPVALVGKTKVRVLGKVKKFDKIVLDPEHPGLGKVQVTSDEKVIGIALENSDVTEEKLIMSVVKVNLD